LAEDIGQALGCGAHLLSLRRTQVAHWPVAQALTLGGLQALTLEQRRQTCLPVDALLQSLPVLKLTDVDALRFGQGQRLKLSPLPLGAPGRVRVYQASNATLLGTAQCDDTGRLQPERLIAIKIRMKQ
jgi:tRNA pseudouridine55 synthase